MKPFLVLSAVLLLLAAPAASAQTAVAGAAAAQPRSDTTSAVAGGLAGAIDAKSSAELKQALDDLALALDRLGRRVAEDPELRASAARTATSFVGLAQLLVVQQSLAVQGALEAIAERMRAVAAPPGQ